MFVKPRALDLYCGAGGMTRGLQDAGFHVTGVDSKAQPNYCGDEFDQADALTFPLDGYDLIHASPPCQDHSSLRAMQDEAHGTGWMLAATLARLREQSTPWIVENVGNARGSMGGAWVTLCGSMFGLQVRRHRLFATSFAVLTPSCNHRDQPEPIDVTGTGGPGGRHRKPRNLEHAREAMGIDWMNRRELSQAVPPAYGRFIGEAALSALEVRA